jgi:hypothetical protein
VDGGRQAENDNLCDLVQSSAFWKNSKALRDVQEPRLVILRKRDSPTARLPDVCPAVFVMDDAIRDMVASKQGRFVLERIPSAALDVM